MDLLARVLEGGRDLLARVDAALVTGGAPPDHPIWPVARRVGALPGDAAEALAALRPDPLLGCATRLRSLVETYAHQRATLIAVTQAGVWDGAGGEAFASQVRAFAVHCGSDGPESLAGRLAETASYVEDVAAWMHEARRMLAGTLAAVLVSAEAVRLRAGNDKTAAAAAIGAQVLETVAAAHAAGHAVQERWAGRLGEVAYRPPTEVPPAHGTTTRVTLQARRAGPTVDRAR
jgi:hypothetical protein